MSKKIVETNTVANITGATDNVFRKRKNRGGNIGAPFNNASNKILEKLLSLKNKKGGFIPSKTGVVVKKNRKKDSKLTYVSAESKSENMLREAIRNLIFLNRVKYHEEQVKNEIQEQKLRKVIRYLLNEADNDEVMLTTGENNAGDFVTNVKSTTFLKSYAKLSSSEEQRIAFRTVYLEKLKLYLDSLDQQHIILHPDDKPQNKDAMEKPEQGNQPSVDAPEQATQPPPEAAAGAEQAPEQPAVDAGAAPPPAKRRDIMQEQDAATPVQPTSVMQRPDTKRLQQQVIATQINKPNLHPTGVKKALDSLKKDMPQIDDLYSQLTFRPLQMPDGSITSDREMFRKMLFGYVDTAGQQFDGNLDYEFNKVDKSVATSDKPTAQPAIPVEKPVPSGTSPGEPVQIQGQEGGAGEEPQV